MIFDTKGEAMETAFFRAGNRPTELIVATHEGVRTELLNAQLFIWQRPL